MNPALSASSSVSCVVYATAENNIVSVVSIYLDCTLSYQWWLRTYHMLMSYVTITVYFVIEQLRCIKFKDSYSCILLIFYTFAANDVRPWPCMLNMRELKMTDQKDQRLENVGPGKWRTKSHGWSTVWTLVLYPAVDTGKPQWRRQLWEFARSWQGPENIWQVLL